MSWSLILACLWVLVSAITAMLPMRLQYVPGIPLLIAAPVLLVYLGVQHGIWVALLGLAAVLSVLRNPIIYFGRKALGLPVELPKEFKEGKP